ncbi:MBG domain-containing protein [Myroides sp. LJL115]
MVKYLQMALLMLFASVAFGQTDIKISPGSGNIIYVTPKGTGDGSSWSKGVDLADALRWAEGKDGYKLWLKEGTYYPKYDMRYDENNPPKQPIEDQANWQYAGFLLTSGIEIYGGFKGNEKKQSERNWRANETILSGDLGNTTKLNPYSSNPSSSMISGNTKNPSHILYFAMPANTTVIIDGVSVFGAYSDYNRKTIKFFKGSTPVSGYNSGAITIITQSPESNDDISQKSNIHIVFSHVHFYGNHVGNNGTIFSDENKQGLDKGDNNGIYFINSLIERNVSKNVAAAFRIEKSTRLVSINNTIAYNYAPTTVGAYAISMEKKETTMTSTLNTIIYDNGTSGSAAYRNYFYSASNASVRKDTMSNTITTGLQQGSTMGRLEFGHSTGGNSRKAPGFIKDANSSQPYFSLKPDGNTAAFNGSRKAYENIIQKFDLDPRDFEANPRSSNFRVTVGAYEIDCDFVAPPVTQEVIHYDIGDEAVPLKAEGDNIYWMPSDEYGGMDTDNATKTPFTPSTAKVGETSYFVYSQNENLCVSEVVEIKVIVHKNSVKVKAENLSKYYGEKDPSFTYSVDPTSVLSGNSMVIGNPVRQSGENVGIYKIQQGSIAITPDPDNYELAFTEGTFTILPSEVNVIPNASSKYFGEKDPVFSYEVSVAMGTYKEGGVEGTLKRVEGDDAGKYNYITSDLHSVEDENGNATYKILIDSDKKFEILKAAVTITPDSGQSKIYGDAEPQSFTYNIDATKGDITNLDYKPVLTREQGINVGHYSILLPEEYQSNKNADIDFVDDVSFSINKRDVVVTPHGVSKQYGEPIGDISYSVSENGIASFDTFTGALALEGNALTAGQYNIVQGSLLIENKTTNQSSMGNYNFTLEPESVIINKAPLEIIAKSYTITFGDPIPTFEYQVKGNLYYDDKISGTLSITPEINGADTYSILTKDVTLTNESSYDVTRTDGSLIIQKANFIGLSLSDTNFEYTGDTFTLPLQGELPENSNVTYAYFKGDTPLSGAPSDVGEYLVIATVTNPNYNSQEYKATLTINPADIEEIELKGATIDYTGNQIFLKISGENSAAIQDNEVTYTYKDDQGNTIAPGPVEVGTYEVTAVIDKTPNYSVWTQTSSLVINPIEIPGLTFKGVDVGYDGTPKEITVSGLESGDTPTYIYKNSDGNVVDQAINVGVYTVEVTVVRNDNYLPYTAEAILTILPIDAGEIHFENAEFNYDGNPHVLAVVGNLPAETKTTITYTLQGESNSTTEPPVNAGVYNAVASFENENVQPIVPLEAVLTIKAIPISGLSLNGSIEVYENKQLCLTLTGQNESTDKVEYTYTNTSDNTSSSECPSDVGTYKVVATVTRQDGTSNYLPTEVESTLTITPAVIGNLSFESKSATYSGGDQRIFVTSTDTNQEVTQGVTYENEGNSFKNVGEYTVTATVDYGKNYQPQTLVATLTITPAAVVVNAKSNQAVYGQAIANADYEVIGLKADDKKEDVFEGQLSYNQNNAVVSQPINVGTYFIENGSLALKTNNYTYSYNANQLVITKATLTIVPDEVIQVYGGEILPITFKAENLQYGDTIGILEGELTRSTGSNVGNYPIVQGSLSDPTGNYNIVVTPALYKIVQANLQVTANAQSVLYGQAIPVFTYEVQGLVNGDSKDNTIKGDLYRISTSYAAGSYPILGDHLSVSPNYNLVYQEANLVISRNILTVTANPQTKVYGEIDPILDYKVEGLAPWDHKEAVLTGSLSRTLGENVGTWAILVGDLQANNNYALKFQGSDLTITPASLNVKANAASKIYGQDDPNFTYTVSGLVNGDDQWVLKGSLERSDKANHNVGSYNIEKGTLATNENYSLNFTGDIFEIHAAQLTVQALTESKIYGESDPELKYQASGFFYGDSAENQLKGNLSRTTGESVNGTYWINQGTLLGVNSNYTIKFVPARFTITPAELIVKALASQKVYGDEDPILNYEVSGLQWEDIQDNVVYGLPKRQKGEDVGKYLISKGDLSIVNNYTLNFVGNNFVITPSLLAITADTQSKVYGQKDPILTYTYKGLSQGDHIDSIVHGQLNRVEGENVGTYGVEAKNLVINANYTLDFTGADFTILPADLTIIANKSTKVYGQVDPILGYSVKGLVNEDIQENVVSGNLKRKEGQDVGSYPLNTNELKVSNNYIYEFVNTDFQITPATLEVKANPSGKYYGEKDPDAFSFVATGFTNHDKQEDVLTGKLERAIGEEVGSYTINQGSLVADSNYSIAYTPSQFTIVGSTITVVANALTKVYGQSDPKLTYDVYGLKPGEIIEGELERVAGDDVGEYEITQGNLRVTNSQGNSNYTIVFTPSKLRITPKDLVVTAQEVSKEYGQSDPVFKYDVNGFVYTEDRSILTGKLSRVQGENVGDYLIQLGNLQATDNYKINFSTANLTITPKVLTVQANSLVKTYGQVDPKLTYKAIGLVGTDSLTGVLERNLGENVGDYSINKGSLQASKNYELDFIEGTLSVVKASLIVKATPSSKLYGQVDPKFEYQLEGLAKWDVASQVIKGDLTRAQGESIGDYDIQKGNLIAGDNYEISFQKAVFSIKKANLEIVIEGKSKVYGQVDPILEVRILGQVEGDFQEDIILSGSPYRVQGEGVGSYEILTDQMVLSNNYQVGFTVGNFSITPATLQVNADSKAKSYGEVDPALTYSLSPLFNNDKPADVLSGSLSRAEGEQIGTYSIDQGSLSVNDNYVIEFQSGELLITQGQIVVVAQNQTKVYGDLDPSLTYQVSGLLPGEYLMGSLSRESIAIGAEQGNGQDVGQYKITIGSLKASNNYSILFVDATLRITPSELVVNALNNQKVYGQEDPSLLYQVDGLKLEDQQEQVLSGDILRHKGEDVGQYIIEQGDLSSNSNYKLRFTQGLFTITKADVLISANPSSKIYGSLDPVLSYNVTGLKNQDVLSGSLSRALGENVGSYAIERGSLRPSGNYNFVFEPSTLTISPASLTVKANAKSKIYGTLEPKLDYQVEGLVNFDAAYQVLSGDLSRVWGENVGVYAIEQGSLQANDNYSIEFVGNDFSITKSNLRLILDNKQKDYSQIDPVLTYDIMGLKGQDLISDAIISGQPIREQGQQVGSYKITQGDIQVSSNYSLSVENGVFTITPSTLKVTANAASKIKGAKDPLFTYMVQGLVHGDTQDEVLSGTLNRTTGEDIGVYTITQGDLVSNSNYELSFKENQFYITSDSNLTVVAVNKTKVYGQQDPSLTYFVTGLQNGETLQGSLIRAEGNDVGTYKITQGTLVSSLGRYITFIEGTLEIEPARLTITPDKKSKVYAQQDPSLTYQVSGLVYSQDVSVVLGGSLSREPGEDAGEYLIQLGSLKANNNYKLSLNPEYFTIEKAPVTIEAIAQNKVYGEADPRLTYTVSGLLGKDVLTGSLYRQPGENVGSYQITQGDLMPSNNYVVTYQSANLTISPRDLTILAQDKTKVYGQADPILTYQVNGLVNQDTSSIITGDLYRKPGFNVGEYPITQGSIKASANYRVNFVPGVLSITPAELVLEVDPKVKEFGQSDPSLTYELKGLTNQDIQGAVISGELQREQGEQVGSYAIEQNTLKASSNYNLVFKGNYLQITPGVLKVRANTLSKVENEPDPAFTYVVSGMVNMENPEDLLQGTLNREQGEKQGEYKINQGTLQSTSPNYTVEYSQGSLIITGNILTVIAKGQTKVYGQEDPQLTYSYSGLKQGVSLSGNLLRDTGENVDIYQIKQGTLVASDNSTINFIESIFEITPSRIKVIAADRQKVYGQKDPSLTYSVEGLVGQDTSKEVFSGNIAREQGEDVGVYWIEKSTLKPNFNYIMNFEVGKFTIEQASVGITADDASKIYGQKDPNLTYQVSGLQANDVLSGELYRVVGENVGQYPIEQGSLSPSGNYKVSYTPGTLTIVAAILDIQADAITKMYSQVDPPLSYKVKGLVNSDLVQDVLTGKLTREPGENVGSYVINQGSLSSTKNYKTQYTSNELTITPLQITVVAEDQTKVYGQKDPSLTYSVIGLLESENPQEVMQGSLKREQGEDTGKYAILLGSLNAGRNYQLSYEPADLLITKASLQVQALNTSKVYKQVDPVLNYKVSGLVNQDLQANVLSGKLVRQPGENAGHYDIEQGSLLANENYYLSFIPGDFIIEKADQVIMNFDSQIIVDYPSTKSLQLNATASSGLPVSYTYANILPADFAVGTPTGLVSIKAVGSMSVTAKQEGSANYNAAYATQSLVVKSSDIKDVEIKGISINGVYYPEISPNQTIDLGCIDEGQDLVIKVDADESVQIKPSREIRIATVDGQLVQDYVLFAASNEQGETQVYEIKLKSNVSSSKILLSKYDNLLFINNNPKTNGGYVFKDFAIYKNGELLEQGQVYSQGNSSSDTIDWEASYSAVLTTVDGQSITTCPIGFESIYTTKVEVAPNPVSVGEQLSVKYDFSEKDFMGASYRIFSSQGKLVDFGNLDKPVSTITIKANLAYGVYFLVLKHKDKQESISIMIKK